MQKWLPILSLLILLPAGCKQQPKIDYSALDQSGMFSTALSQVKDMKPSNGEIAQLAALKRAGAGDDLCLALLRAARAHHHEFTSGDSAVQLSRAGYSDAQILEMDQAGKVDILSADAVMLKLMGLSNATVQAVIERREQGLPTLTSEQIGRFKNTGMSEPKILDLINQGLSGQQAEDQIARLEAVRDHSHTSFVHVRGRRAR